MYYTFPFDHWFPSDKVSATFNSCTQKSVKIIWYGSIPTDGARLRT